MEKKKEKVDAQKVVEEKPELKEPEEPEEDEDF